MLIECCWLRDWTKLVWALHQFGYIRLSQNPPHMFVMVLVLLLLKKELCISLAFLIGVIHKVLHIQRTKFVFLEEILLSIESNRLFDFLWQNSSSAAYRSDQSMSDNNHRIIYLFLSCMHSDCQQIFMSQAITPQHKFHASLKPVIGTYPDGCQQQ